MKIAGEAKFSSLYLALKKGLNPFQTSQVRDLTKIGLGNKYALIIAVDSDGGIGPLPADVVKCSDYTLGRFAIRVPLMEIIASGAYPLAAFDMLTLPMQPHGIEVIRGIQAELAEAGLNEDFPLSGSTEDNIPTSMTGVGTLVMGLVKEEDFRPGSSQLGDQVLCLGLPKSGPEDVVSLEDDDIIRLSQLKEVTMMEGVNDILPVGSRGVLFEFV
jgi:selenophosphate synthetase-related protein